MSSLIDFVALATLPAFLLIDMALRRRQADWGWRLRAFWVSLASFALSMAIGTAWAHLFDGASLLELKDLNTAAAAFVGVLTYEFFHYWYHRLAHRFHWLWLSGHQLHHSAEVLDPWGAYFLHPVDTSIFVSLSSLVLFPILGVSPLAGAWAGAFLTFAAVFQHASFRTPHWVGYLIQRPESHAIHHARGVHAFNYADLPLWDMVFGTFRNPRDREEARAQGFYDGASRRLWEMLRFKDVNGPDLP